MNLSNFNIETWQMILAMIIYIAYLCFVMFGGLRKRKLVARKYILMSLLLVYSVIRLFDGFGKRVAVINLLIIIGIAVVKGIYLGHKKIVENIDGQYYIWHNKYYIVRWVCFFVGKIIITSLLKYFTGEKIPMWHTVFYLCLYYIIRSITIFAVHNELWANKKSLKKVKHYE